MNISDTCPSSITTSNNFRIGSNDYYLVTVGFEDGRIVFWNPCVKGALQCAKFDKESVNILRWKNPSEPCSSQWLAVGYERGNLVIYDVKWPDGPLSSTRNQRCISNHYPFVISQRYKIKAHDRSVTACLWLKPTNPGDGDLVTGSRDRTVKVWLLSDELRQVKTLRIPNDSRSGADEGSGRKYQGWIAFDYSLTEQTKEKVSKLFDSLDPTTRLVLVNAVYFKGKWRVPFNHAYNEDFTFQFLNGPSRSMSMMCMERNMTFLKHEDAKGCFLPFKGDQYEFICIVPEPHLTLQEFMVKHFNSSFIKYLTTHQNKLYGKLIMPKFRMECEIDLKSVMTKLGVEKCFSKESADLSGITDAEKLFVNQAVHKTYLAVNEKGVEAAAITGIGMIPMCLPPPPQIIVKADRPFLSVIWDTKQEILVFIGAVTDPNEF